MIEFFVGIAGATMDPIPWALAVAAVVYMNTAPRNNALFRPWVEGVATSALYGVVLLTIAGDRVGDNGAIYFSIWFCAEMLLICLIWFGWKGIKAMRDDE